MRLLRNERPKHDTNKYFNVTNKICVKIAYFHAFMLCDNYYYSQLSSEKAGDLFNFVGKGYEYFQSKKIGDFVSLKLSSEDKPGDNDNIFKNFIINDIKTAIWLLEETPQLVFAISGKLNHEFDDFATTLLGFKDSKTVIISSNWIKSKRNRNLELVCTNDKVSITNDDWNVSLDNSTFDDNATNIAEAAFLSSQKGIPIYLDLK